MIVRSAMPASSTASSKRPTPSSRLLHHRRIERVVLRVLSIGLRLEVLDVVAPRIPGRMHRVGPVVDVERPVLVRADELGRLLRHAVLDVLARLAG